MFHFHGLYGLDWWFWLEIHDDRNATGSGGRRQRHAGGNAPSTPSPRPVSIPANATCGVTSRVKVPIFCRWGKSLNVAMNFPATACFRFRARVGSTR